jgi:threonine synthase
VKKFVVAVNANDEFPTFVTTGQYHKIVPSKDCLSNAMNVGHPSNFARLVALYGGQIDEQGNFGKMPDLEAIRRDMYAISISDPETQQTLKHAYEAYKLLLEPHGAVAWAGLQHYLAAHPADDTPTQVCVSLETAHPAKFPDEIRHILGLEPELPASMQGLDTQAESFSPMPHDYAAFKQYLQQNY